MALLGDVRRVEVPLVSSKQKAGASTADAPIELIMIHKEIGPLAFYPGTRMKPFRTVLPAKQDHAYGVGPMRIDCTDRCGGRSSFGYHIWGNKTSTQRQIDLLTVAKKNKLLRDLHGDTFCKRQECDFLVRNLPTTKVVVTGPFKIGDTAEFEIPEGEAAGVKVLCRVSGPGKEAGTYNIRCPRQPPIFESQTDLETIPDYLLTKQKVTVWRCSYKLGMDIHETPESEGPIKNNLMRTRPVLQQNEVVRVAQEYRAEDGILYLRLEDGRGWIYDAKPGVGVACVRDEGAADLATGIEVVVPDADEKVLDIDVLAARLRIADAPAMIMLLQKVGPEQRSRLLANLPEEKQLLLREHFLADTDTIAMEKYLLLKELYKVHEVKAKLQEGFGAGGG